MDFLSKEDIYRVIHGSCMTNVTASEPVQAEGADDRLGVVELPATWMYPIAGALIALFFVADILLPRGATAAIGYCLVPVILGGTRFRILLGATILCTLLTVVGYWSEGPGSKAWFSVFDRAMVGGVLWLTFFLARRRAMFLHAMIRQTKMLSVVSAELRRSNDDLEQFASTVAHDLRSPLGAIGLLAQLLAGSESVKSDQEAVESVDAISSELKHMNQLIQSLLQYARAGAREIEPADCDCSAVLEGVRLSLLPEIERNSAKISSENLPSLRADPTLIAQLFQNLIENGLKYRSAAPPQIHVSATAQADGSWLFSIRDNGVGLSQEDCARIFRPFFQVAKGASPSAGIGLGLATCKRIVQRHGGRIWVESKPGAETTFLFNIPPLEHGLTRATSPEAKRQIA
jgi:signal transduction histidine kinase